MPKTRKSPDAVAAAIPQITKAVDGIVERFRTGGRLFYIGAGTSGRLGVLDASECPPTYSVSYDMVQGIIAGGRTGAHPGDGGQRRRPRRAELATCWRADSRAGDTLVGIAASGRTPYVLGAIRKAREMGGADGRDRLLAGFRAGAGVRNRDRADYRARRSSPDRRA